MKLIMKYQKQYLKLKCTMSIKLRKKMVEIVCSVNLLVVLLIVGVGFVLYYIFNYD